MPFTSFSSVLPRAKNNVKWRRWKHKPLLSFWSWGNTSYFFIKHDIRYTFSINAFIILTNFLLFLLSFLKTKNPCWIFQMPFLHLLKQLYSERHFCQYGIFYKLIFQMLRHLCNPGIKSAFFFFSDRVLLFLSSCWSAMAWSRLTATAVSWVQAILLPQPPE